MKLNYYLIIFEDKVTRFHRYLSVQGPSWIHHRTNSKTAESALRRFASLVQFRHNWRLFVLDFIYFYHSDFCHLYRTLWSPSTLTKPEKKSSSGSRFHPRQTQHKTGTEKKYERRRRWETIFHLGHTQDSIPACCFLHQLLEREREETAAAWRYTLFPLLPACYTQWSIFFIITMIIIIINKYDEAIIAQLMNNDTFNDISMWSPIPSHRNRPVMKVSSRCTQLGGNVPRQLNEEYWEFSPYTTTRHSQLSSR